MPDELKISLSAYYEPRFVPSDGTKPVLYDADHQIKFQFDGAASSHDMFLYASLSAKEKYGMDGWCFGFGGRTYGANAAKVGDTDMVTIVYNHDGITIMKRVKLTAVE